MSPRIRKIERVSITDQVVKELLSLIMSGDFKLEEKLPTESELCNHLGVGRSTVREALRVLSATGMIELRPGKGAYVVSNKKNSIISIQNWFTEKHAELDELIEVRMAIEPLALKLAIRRASNEEIQQIIAIHDAFTDAVKTYDNIELATLDESFHNAIVEASGNRLLIKIGRLISDPMMEFRLRSFGVKKNIDHATEPHGEIAKSMLNRDEIQGSLAMIKHLDIAREDMNLVVNSSKE